MTKWFVTIYLRRKYTIKEDGSWAGVSHKEQYFLIREEDLPLWKTNGCFVRVCQPCYPV